MESLNRIIRSLEENGIRAVVFDSPRKRLSIVNIGSPIHDLTYDQVTDLYTSDAFGPEVLQFLVDHGVIPRSSWDS